MAIGIVISVVECWIVLDNILFVLSVVLEPSIYVYIWIIQTNILGVVQIDGVYGYLLHVRSPIRYHVIICECHIAEIQINKATLLFGHIIHHDGTIDHVVWLRRNIDYLSLCCILFFLCACIVWHSSPLIVQRLLRLPFLLLNSFFETSIDI